MDYARTLKLFNCIYCRRWFASCLQIQINAVWNESLSFQILEPTQPPISEAQETESVLLCNCQSVS